MENFGAATPNGVLDGCRDRLTQGLVLVLPFKKTKKKKLKPPWDQYIPFKYVMLNFNK